MDREKLCDQYLQLYKAGEGKGVFILEYDPEVVLEKDWEYEMTYPIDTETKEEFGEILRGINKDGYEFKGETKRIYCAWLGTIKDYTNHTYYLFKNRLNGKIIELALGDIKDSVTEDEFDDYLKHLEDIGIFPNPNLWFDI